MQKRLGVLTTTVVKSLDEHYDDILLGVQGMGRGEEYMRELMEGIHDGTLTLILLCDAGVPIGATCYETNYNCNTEEYYATHVFMYIKPEYRGGGLASALDAALQAEAKRTDHVRVCYTIPHGELEGLVGLLNQWGYHSRYTTYTKEL